MVIFAYSITVLLMILLPIFLAVLLRRRFQVPWFLFCAGMVTFIASQVVHLPLNDLLGKFDILPRAGAINTPPLWQTAVVAGLTAGICEELARTAGYAILRRYHKFEDGMMMGLGHGGIESMIFGGVMTAATVSSLLPLIGSDLSTLPISAAQQAALKQQLDTLVSAPWMAVLPLMERAIAIALHVVLSMLVLKAFQSRNAWYVVLAILYHAVTDAGAVYLAQYLKNPWLIEGIFALVVLPGWIWLIKIFPRKGAGWVRHTTPVSTDWAVFITALRKEILQQWRTRRVLVVVAIFGLFGMASPLLAYFTPQMVKAIPGAEQFSSLIPTPTTASSMAQYVKNISQFGFILAILLGMGAVAGEKERGTASMILSKPMTRWAFVTSKLTAQVIVYLLGFLLSMLGAYFYTIVLFGDTDFGVFTFLNLLLVFWLLPYVAVTLLGSVIGNSTGAAAGIGLAGAVLLMIFASIPRYGILMPGGLLSWIDQLGAGTSVNAPNGGALASSIIFSLVCLITSIAIFEKQEL